MFELKAYLSSKKQLIDKRLDEIVPAENHFGQCPRIVEAMRYSLLGGGKRLRPVLCIAASEACGSIGQTDEAVLNAACALEMIHTYSLIHDDLPAMDNDGIRRGKPTCHVAFDEATAILAGDALLTLAFDVLSETVSEKNNPASVMLKVIHILAAAAGHRGMVEGQMRDMLSEGVRLSLEQLRELHLHKTGALIEASVWCGAVLAGAEGKTLENLRAYGRQVGLAFQIMDDVLNVEGDPVTLGKSIGTDAERKKNTYPAIIGIESSKALATDTIRRASETIADLDGRAHPLRAIADYIINRHH
jgi:geranylgeranyl diphosphate synthase type II